MTQYYKQFVAILRCLLMLSLTCSSASALAAENTSPEHAIDYQLRGVDNDIEENILAQLQSQEPDATQRNSETIQEYYQKMPSIIEKAIQPFGYFDAKVQGELQVKKSVFTKTKHWQVNFTITLGQPVLIDKVTMKLYGAGRTNKHLIRYTKTNKLQKGSILNSAIYEETKQGLFDLAYAHGYLDATNKFSQVEIDLTTHTADVTIEIDTGAQYYLGKLTFTQFGEHQFAHRYLKKFITYYEGATYSPEALLNMQRDLLTTGDFASVQIIADKENAVNFIVPVEVQLAPSKRNRYTFGIGYGTDTNLRGTVAWERRRINRLGHHIAASVQASSLQRIFQARYSIPGKHPATDSYNLNVGYQESTVDTGDRDTELVSIDYTKHFWQYWQRIIALTFIHENFEPIVDGEKQAEKTKQLLSPSLTYTKIKKDDPLKPHNGHRLYFDLRGALEELSSSTSYLQAHAQGKYLMMPNSRLRFLARGDLGLTVVETFNDLPLSQRFITGGPQTVRGYELEALGPGRYLAILSAETQMKLYGDWFLGGFMDAGNASNQFLPHLRKSLGVSLSWLSPIGTISVSAAKPLDKLYSNDDKDWLFQLNLGPDI